MPAAYIHLRPTLKYIGLGDQATLCGRPKAVRWSRSAYNPGYATCPRCLEKRGA